MNSIILCEGFDDILILGYFIYKTSNNPKWFYNDKAIISENFKIPKMNNRNAKIEIYTRGNDKLAIWCVGGKDNFDFAIKTIHKFSTNFPEERFEEIIIFSDRDKDEIDTTITKIENMFKNYGWMVSLSNNKQNLFRYEIESEEYQVNLSPIIIPFDIEGALETILIAGIAGTSDEDNFVVDSAKQYIKNIFESGRLFSYLQHDRLKLKAEFSAVISITNPDRSTCSFNNLLTSHNWEEKPEIKRHFELIEEIFK